MTWLAVAAGGAVGAPTRFLLDRWVQERTRSILPIGTLAVNVAGSLVLGVVAGLARYHGVGGVPQALLGTGFCGALTTFSTFAYETVRLLDEGAWPAAARSATLQVVLGTAAAGLALGAVGLL